MLALIVGRTSTSSPTFSGQASTRWSATTAATPTLTTWKMRRARGDTSPVRYGVDVRISRDGSFLWEVTP